MAMFDLTAALLSNSRLFGDILPVIAEDPAAELRDAFRLLDESSDSDAPDNAAIAAAVRAWRARR